MTGTVAIAIPTFRRPAALATAIESVLRQEGVPAFDLLVVDNDPDMSARAVFDEFCTRAPVSVRMLYVSEPRPGVSNARNAAIDNTSCRLVAFLDDDQSAAPGWLAAYLRAAASYPAAVTFGPVDTLLPDEVKAHKSYFRAFFSRTHSGGSGYCSESYGCGNSLLDLDLIPLSRPMFDAAMNETGGEDDMLFKRVREAGGRFAWCADAVANEHVPAFRATLAYTLKRSLAYGQGPITLARKRQPPNYPAIGLWMLVGLAKAASNSVLYVGKWLVRAEDRAINLDRAARGAGKLIWWVKLRFYGQTSVEAAR